MRRTLCAVHYLRLRGFWLDGIHTAATGTSLLHDMLVAHAGLYSVSGSDLHMNSDLHTQQIL